MKCGAMQWMKKNGIWKHGGSMRARWRAADSRQRQIREGGIIAHSVTPEQEKKVEPEAESRLWLCSREAEGGICEEFKNCRCWLVWKSTLGGGKIYISCCSSANERLLLVMVVNSDIIWARLSMVQANRDKKPDIGSRSPPLPAFPFSNLDDAERRLEFYGCEEVLGWHCCCCRCCEW